ncbi:SHOCT domain-containing protein, partial [Allosphingosinicella sp.]|uniref:SHOCT domain-containing protein n=1 Tax=Allosphingosinicella sp. TaxID=2823234 RepID=UPI002EE4A3C3
MTDRIDALERLQKLRESGAITEAEFDREKAALLEQPESSPATIEPPSAHGPRSTGRVPIWALLAAGAVLLALIVGAMLLLRSSDGGRASGDDVTARAEANESAPVNAVEAAPAPTIRSRPETEQLAAAFRAAFGNRPTRQVGQADITYRPGTLLWIGERAVLISDGTNPHECHACAGMVAVHALLPA